MVGERIRKVRQAQRLSLADVAEKAEISVATLSRIETNKQSLEMGLFIVLARVLSISPQQLLGNDAPATGANSGDIAAQIASLEPDDRTRMWRDLAANNRARRNARRAGARDIGCEVDELLAQIDFLREEVETVRARMKRRSSR